MTPTKLRDTAGCSGTVPSAEIAGEFTLKASA